MINVINNVVINTQVNLRTEIVYQAIKAGVKDLNDWVNTLAERELELMKANQKSETKS